VRKSLLVALLLVACGDDSSGPRDTGAPELEFDLQQSTAVDIGALKTVVTGGQGRIDVDGETYTICRSNYLLPELRVNTEGTYTILVIEQETEFCQGTQTTAYEYDATITRMPPGRHHLQVLFVHARGVTPPRTVFHDFIDVR